MGAICARRTHVPRPAEVKCGRMGVVGPAGVTSKGVSSSDGRPPVAVIQWQAGARRRVKSADLSKACIGPINRSPSFLPVRRVRSSARADAGIGRRRRRGRRLRLRRHRRQNLHLLCTQRHRRRTVQKGRARSRGRLRLTALPAARTTGRRHRRALVSIVNEVPLWRLLPGRRPWTPLHLGFANVDRCLCEFCALRPGRCGPHGRWCRLCKDPLGQRRAVHHVSEHHGIT